MATLVSAVRVALQTRRRQYELRDHLRERARLEAALQAEYEKQHHIAETLQRSLLNDARTRTPSPAWKSRPCTRPPGTRRTSGAISLTPSR